MKKQKILKCQANLLKTPLRERIKIILKFLEKI